MARTTSRDHVFSGLDDPVLSMPRNVPLSRQAAVCFFVHLLKGFKGHLGGILVLVVFTEASLDFCVQVFVWTCFQLLWVNTKECDHWIICISLRSRLVF